MAWLVLSMFRSVPKTAGLFAPISGASWPAYRSSMLSRADAWGVRGHAQLKPLVMSTRVQDGCGQSSVPVYQDTGGFIDVDSIGKMFSAECPPKDSSYISFCPTVTLLTNTRTIPMYSTGDAGPTAQGETSAVTTTTFQESGSQKYRVRFRGAARRVGYPVDEPKLISYGGAKAIKKIFEETFETEVVGMSEGCEIHQASWDQTWELEKAPKGNSYKTFPDHNKVPCPSGFSRSGW